MTLEPSLVSQNPKKETRNRPLSPSPVSSFAVTHKKKRPRNAPSLSADSRFQSLCLSFFVYSFSFARKRESACPAIVV